MDCPLHAVELVKKAEEGQVEVDACPDCDGIWLGKGELEAILRAHRAARRRDVPSDGPVAEAWRVAIARREVPLACPCCRGEMERREYAMTSQILIDVCIAGCGVWLDGGELSELERFYDEQKAGADAELGFFGGIVRLLLG